MISRKLSSSEFVHIVSRPILLATLIFAFAVAPADAQIGTVLAKQKVSEHDGNFDGLLSPEDWFGWSVAAIGDIDGDEIPDIAVGAPQDDDGTGKNTGALWILFMNDDGSLSSHQKISDTKGSFNGDIDALDQFGHSIAGIGDIDGNGVADLAVGAPFDDDGSGENRGAVWILFMKADGTVDHHQKISASSGNFDGSLTAGDAFGSSVAAIGDIDGNGFGDIAVGAPFDDDGSEADVGAVWILFMKAGGNVRSHQKISRDKGQFGGDIENGDWFGSSVVSPGDLNGDGRNDLVVGAPADDDGDGADSGAIWVIFLNSDGQSKGHQKISDGKGGLNANLDPGDFFGFGLGNVGDFNRDGVGDVVVGAPLDDDGGGSDTGAVYLLMLGSDGFVLAEQKISNRAGSINDELDGGDSFGNGVTGIGDLDGDGIMEICVGTPSDDDGDGKNSGAIWNLFLEGSPFICGDADGSGTVSSSDALLTLNAAVGLAACNPCVCDVDGSGSVTASDSSIILNAVVGLPVQLNCPACP